MLLCLDVGNSHIFGGVFQGDNIILHFRHATYSNITSDQLGIFLKNILLLNNIGSHEIDNVAICSVVPSMEYSLDAACKKYLAKKPFILDISKIPSVSLTIKIPNPMEMGADIIAGALAAMQTYPHKNLLVVDLGTITTITPLTKNRECLGSTFIPGIGTAMNSFAVKATKLFAVEIITPKKCLGRSTAESMQAGLFFGHLGAIKEIIQRISAEIFPHDQPLVIATGGFAKLFEREKIFNHIEPDLILKGLKIVHKKS